MSNGIKSQGRFKVYDSYSRRAPLIGFDGSGHSFYVPAAAAIDLDLISFLKAIPDAHMRKGIRIPVWYLLLVAAPRIVSKCESLRDLERFGRRHNAVLYPETLGTDLKRPPSDSAFRYFFLQVDEASICAANRDWTLA